MPTLSTIRGQDRVISLMRRAVTSDRVAHAYLFVGPAHCGKHTTGLALAKALNCESHPGEGCFDCTPCSKIDGGIHPDVETLPREGAAQMIPIETIRNRVIPKMGLAPNEAKVRVILVDEATALGGPSANALLKTLEEPPPRTVFVLCTSAPDKLLPTIRSRCQRVNFAALSPDLRAAVNDGGDAESDTAATLTALAAQLEAAEAATSLGLLHRAAAEATADKAQVAPALELLATRYHEHARAAALDGDLATAQRAGAMAREVLICHQAISTHNAHPLLTVEALLYRLRKVA